MIVPRARQSLEGRPEDLTLAAGQRPPEWTEYFGASVGEAFERTTTSAFATEAEVHNRERERYGAAAPGVIQDVNNIPGLYDDSLSGTVYDASTYDFSNEPVYIAQDEWNDEHPLFRSGVKWREGMTEVRAELYAEDYDKRQARQMIIERGSRNFGVVKGTAAGFVAGVVGSLPDPINVIPFGAGIRAGNLVRGVGRGAVEGLAGNMAVNAVVLPDLASRGADVGFTDFIIDSAFGAVVGGLFGGAGYGARYLSKRHFASPDIAAENRNPLNDQMRQQVRGQSRTDIVDSFALAAEDVSAGQPVDVGGVLRNPSTIKAVEVEALIARLNGGNFSDVSFGQLRPDLKEALNSIRAEDGVSLIVDDNLVIPAAVVEKLYEKRILKDHMSANEVAELLLNVFHRDADFVAGTKHPHINAVVALREELSEIGFISINPRTGQTVIKSGYKVSTGVVGKQIRAGESAAPEGRPTPSSQAINANGERQPGLTDHRNSALAEPNILHAPHMVNRFATETPDTFTPAPELSAAERGILEEAGIDPNTLTSQEELLARQEIEAGRVLPEDAAPLAEAEAALTRADQVEEAGLSVLGCVMEVIE